jgi:hypothetical protein
MKIYSETNIGNGAASRSLHKGIQNRAAVTKTIERRYERRKVRALLRHPEIFLNDGE